MWTYHQTSGHLQLNDTLVGFGYSGHGPGLNNSDMQYVRGVGPACQGTYTIGPPKNPVDHLGPLAMPLIPTNQEQMHGRADFFIHGDNAAADHTASDGCLIFDHNIRAAIAASTDHQLTVVE